MRCTIKPMKLADYNEVLHLWQNTKGVGLNESDSRAQIRGFLKRNRGMSFVARDGAELVGAVLCGHDGRRGCLYHLAIAPSHRRNGLGTKLILRCLAELKKSGILKCNIFVYANNEQGERFWRRNGWKKREDLRMAQKDIGSLRDKRGC
jgi:ribosomal protein S18 acetylase RimI-like enzyme